MNLDTLLSLVLPVGIGIVVAVALYFLRRLLYSFVHKLTAKTKTCFDDILVHETRLATLFWCVWLGIFAGYKIAVTPEAWVADESRIISTLFVALGIYTAIVVVMAILKWYQNEICPKTNTSLDDLIMSTLIFGTPIVGGSLGLIQILNMWGIKNDNVNNWLNEHLAGLAFLMILGVALVMLTILIVPRVIHTVVQNSGAGQTEEELKKRADTLVSVIGTTLQIVIIFIFVLMIIIQLWKDWAVITPVLTSTAVVGVALGFGAQSLVKDALAGLFIIMENQYRKGDVVKIADVSGVVEEINLRRTILRDMDGITHVVPNGEIRVASNYTKQWSRANLNISVSYDTDLDKAIAVINRVGQELAEDPEWASAMITPPKALRVDNLGESGIEIKVIGDTKPIRQWDVMGELRLRLKKAFDKEGIEIPWPHTKVYFGNLPPQLLPKEPGVKIEDNPPTKKLNP
jgi:moderate conductance mechanosensitive channel